jgi:hypothetical protein
MDESWSDLMELARYAACAAVLALGGVGIAEAQDDCAAQDLERRAECVDTEAEAPPPVDAAALPTFEEVDTDGDGRISKLELALIEGVDFEQADTDQSGTLSREEYVQAQ